MPSRNLNSKITDLRIRVLGMGCRIVHGKTSLLQNGCYLMGIDTISLSTSSVTISYFKTSRDIFGVQANADYLMRLVAQFLSFFIGCLLRQCPMKALRCPE